jgi:hypothetical protein
MFQLWKLFKLMNRRSWIIGLWNRAEFIVLTVHLPALQNMVIIKHNSSQYTVLHCLDWGGARISMKGSYCMATPGFQMAFCLCLGFSIKKHNTPIFLVFKYPPPLKLFWERLIRLISDYELMIHVLICI